MKSAIVILLSWCIFALVRSKPQHRMYWIKIVTAGLVLFFYNHLNEAAAQAASYILLVLMSFLILFTVETNTYDKD